MAHFIENISQSKLWQRIEYGAADSEQRKLVANVQAVAEVATDLSERVCERMPQYTLHNKRHLWNVISIIETLMGEDQIGKLSVFEASITLFAALTHDLGMILTGKEWEEIGKGSSSALGNEFSKFGSSYESIQQQISKCRGSNREEDQLTASILWGYILSEYLRSTHADSRSDRIFKWLNEIKYSLNNESLFTYDKFDFQRELALIGLSHGCPPTWLRKALTKGMRESGFYKIVRTGERANLAFPGILIRLADIMDFDASRTPLIIFRNLSVAPSESVREWRKHLEVVGWEISKTADDVRLEYAAKCTSPYVHKAILHYLKNLQLEITQCREEMKLQSALIGRKDSYRLELPIEVISDVHPIGYPDNPAYVYEDLSFALSNDEIKKLLLGTSLWGDVQIVFRELIQNSFDAMRLKYIREEKIKAQVGTSSNGDPIVGLRVELSWGEDDYGKYITIRDHGCGMTKQILLKYFTQFGKSYYKSDEFKSEMESVEGQLLQWVPISSFGLGFASCFMIADVIHIRTNAGNLLSDEKYDVNVQGDSQMIWLKPGSLESEGTEITLYLKERRRLPTPNFYIMHADVKELYWMRFMRSPKMKNSNDVIIDPLRSVINNIISPMFPVCISTEDYTWIHNNVAMEEYLRRPNTINVNKELIHLGYIRNQISIPFNSLPINWRYMDWIDTGISGEAGTGTRIRTWIPCMSKARGKISIRDLAEIVKPGIDPTDFLYCVEQAISMASKNLLLLNGIAVNDTTALNGYMDVRAGLGVQLWIDVSGSMVPDLTVDRQTVLSAEDNIDYGAQWRGLWRRFWQSLKDEACACGDWELGILDTIYCHKRYDLASKRVSRFISENSIEQTQEDKDLIEIYTRMAKSYPHYVMKEYDNRELLNIQEEWNSNVNILDYLSCARGLTPIKKVSNKILKSLGKGRLEAEADALFREEWVESGALSINAGTFLGFVGNASIGHALILAGRNRSESLEAIIRNCTESDYSAKHVRDLLLIAWQSAEEEFDIALDRECGDIDVVIKSWIELKEIVGSVLHGYQKDLLDDEEMLALEYKELENKLEVHDYERMRIEVILERVDSDNVAMYDSDPIEEYDRGIRSLYVKYRHYIHSDRALCVREAREAYTKCQEGRRKFISNKRMTESDEQIRLRLKSANRSYEPHLATAHSMMLYEARLSAFLFYFVLAEGNHISRSVISDVAKKGSMDRLSPCGYGDAVLDESPTKEMLQQYDIVFPDPAYDLWKVCKDVPIRQYIDMTDINVERGVMLWLMMPFLFPELRIVLPEFMCETLPDEGVMAFLPKSQLWSKAFNSWDSIDRASGGITGLWDPKSGDTYWKWGLATRGLVLSKGESWRVFYSDL